MNEKTLKGDVVLFKEEVSEWRNKIFHGNCLDVLRHMPNNFVSAVVTDPPYGLSSQPNMREVLKQWLSGEDYKHTDSGFMGQEWDSFVPGPKIWEEIMRVLKPGGHIFSFSGSRTYDLMVTAMRIAGSEIRDKIDYICEQHEPFSWYHGQGFPKSLNIGKQLEKDILNAIEDSGEDMKVENGEVDIAVHGQKMKIVVRNGKFVMADNIMELKKYGTALKPAHEPIAVFGKDSDSLNPDVPFKYESKAGTKERNLGCESLYWSITDEGTKLLTKEKYDVLKSENDTRKDDEGFVQHKLMNGNIHSTVKPVELMRYLIKMVKMPGENLILDPFCGSGTTLVACELEGCGYVGIDLDETSVIISKARTEYAKNSGGKGFKS